MTYDIEVKNFLFHKYFAFHLFLTLSPIRLDLNLLADLSQWSIAYLSMQQQFPIYSCQLTAAGQRSKRLSTIDLTML